MADPRNSSVDVRQVAASALPTCLDIRRVVFIDEQSVPVAEEVDGLDGESTHFLATMADGRAVGTARVRVLGAMAKAERVAVLRDARGAGVGRLLMLAVERFAVAQGLQGIKLGAQVQVIGFYEGLGYRVVGPLYLDAGIEHRDMLKGL